MMTMMIVYNIVKAVLPGDTITMILQCFLYPILQLYGRKHIYQIAASNQCSRHSHSMVPVGVVIDSTIRGKGYGSKLLREIKRYYVDTRYELFTSTRSVDIIRLYEKLGYKIFDEKKITDELVFVYMEKMPV